MLLPRNITMINEYAIWVITRSVFLATCISLNDSVNIGHYQKLFILYIEAPKR